MIEDILSVHDARKKLFDYQLISNYRKCKNRYLHNHSVCEKTGPSAYSFTDVHTDNVKKPKNEICVRSLPLAEDSLGLLYKPRIDEDKDRLYYSIWYHMYHMQFIKTMGEKWEYWLLE